MNWILNVLKKFAMQNELDEKEIIYMINFIEKIPKEDLNINNEQDDEQDVKREFLDFLWGDHDWLQQLAKKESWQVLCAIIYTWIQSEEHWDWDRT